jgi:cardiolipin synthase
VHRKIALIDGTVGFVGGINLIDDMTECLSEFPRYDYAVQVEGPVLADIYLEMVRLWRVVSWWKFGRRNKSVPLPDLPTHVPLPLISATRVGNTNVFFAVRDNFRHRRDIERAYLLAIANARRDVLITSPYFLPGRHFRRALIMAVARGVKVTLLLQGRADHALLQQATRALYTQMLGAGIAIFEYHHSMLHGKVAVVDDTWATVGSSNLEPFSLFLNREANVVVIDEIFAKALRTSVMEEINLNATRLDPTDWRNRRWLDRASSWVSYGFARWVMGWLGFAKRWD